ncbi:substrate-binding periplasmic protein [Vibrio ouci]|uniref:Transporter substrate-binding domain-containing protein n=1 Tax=Vibrio ouci TaxID=2499078 RepID=A0A4Y8WBX5_9VIBR|nr:transporter substrate-binding domain-containing protein [Vibrio ouci]TFH90297.1 transporter substrate-binding domain-containing protein [Vibrio ouci]
MKWLLLPTILISSACLAYSPPTDVVVYGDDAYPPYSYLQEGMAKGIYAEILYAVFERMPDYRVIIKPIPWKRGLKMLKIGQSFALFPPYYFPDKRPYISPYSDPILNEEVVVYCRPDRVKALTLKQWPEDYFGLTIGINEAFEIGGKAFWEAVNDGKITLLEAKGNRPSILNLYHKKSDCYVNDKLSILWEVRLLIQEGQIESDWPLQLGHSISGEQGYLGFTNASLSRYPYKHHFIRQFNQALEQIKQEGIIDDILASYTVNHP